MSSHLIFTAAAGQANQVTVTESGDALLVTDAGDEINPGDGCTAVDAHTASCSVPDVGIRLELGDGNDQATNNTSHPARIDGGPGGDTLTGGSKGDVIDGAEGADTVNGNGGGDIFYEGRSAAVVDVLDRDVYSGGEGVDTVSYQSGTARINVDLDGLADDGRPREWDNVGADIEWILGTQGDDRLTGDADNNHLFGAAGNDALFGGAGHDVLSGGPGTDSCDVGPDGGSEATCES